MSVPDGRMRDIYGQSVNMVPSRQALMLALEALAGSMKLPAIFPGQCGIAAACAPQ
jgi:hypothetical protein